MELKDYSTEELRAELKRRNDLAKDEKAKVKRCRMCKHWGEITFLVVNLMIKYIMELTDAVNFSKTKQENITRHTVHLSLLARILKKKRKHYDKRGN